MRLCLIGSSGSIHLRRWAEHFSKGNDLIVISDSPDGIDGVRVEQVFQMKAGFRNLRRIRRLRKMVREFGPDVVHGHYLTVGGFYASLSGGKKIVGSALGSDIYYGPKRSVLERMILWFVLRRCDLVFTVSKDSMEWIKSRRFKGQLELVRFGVDADKFSRRAHHGTDEFRVLSFRYCSPIYNQKIVILGFKKALPLIKNAYLYVVDSGETVRDVHSLVESDSELSDRVRFVPRQSYDVMPDLYNSADVGISIPSSDGMPSSVIEAMSCELPVIVADIPSMAELVEPGVTGYLTKITEDGVSEMIIKAYAARSMLPSMGKRARAHVLDPKNQLTWDSNMHVAEAAYQKLVHQ